jgi:hypothetical protein
VKLEYGSVEVDVGADGFAGYGMMGRWRSVEEGMVYKTVSSRL